MKKIKTYKSFININESTSDYNWEQYESQNPEFFFMGEKDKAFIFSFFSVSDANELLMLHPNEQDVNGLNYVIINTNDNLSVIHENNSQYHDIFNFRGATTSDGVRILFLKVTSTAPVYDTEYKAYIMK